jgi:hypothetical protein
VTLGVLLLFSATGLSFRYVAYTGLDLRAIMQVLVTCAVGGCSLFVILSKGYGPKDKHWAYATVGTLLGYWLK